jgi:hypothetical protein
MHLYFLFIWYTFVGYCEELLEVNSICSLFFLLPQWSPTDAIAMVLLIVVLKGRALLIHLLFLVIIWRLGGGATKVKNRRNVGVRQPLQSATQPHWETSPMAIRAIPGPTRRHGSPAGYQTGFQTVFGLAASFFIQLWHRLTKNA